jgi:hypothetical protein
VRVHVHVCACVRPSKAQKKVSMREGEEDFYLKYVRIYAGLLSRPPVQGGARAAGAGGTHTHTHTHTHMHILTHNLLLPFLHT